MTAYFFPLGRGADPCRTGSILFFQPICAHRNVSIPATTGLAQSDTYPDLEGTDGGKDSWLTFHLVWFAGQGVALSLMCIFDLQDGDPSRQFPPSLQAYVLFRVLQLVSSLYFRRFKYLVCSSRGKTGWVFWNPSIMIAQNASSACSHDSRPALVSY